MSYGASLRLYNYTRSNLLPDQDICPHNVDQTNPVGGRKLEPQLRLHSTNSTTFHKTDHSRGLDRNIAIQARIPGQGYRVAAEAETYEL